MGGEEGENHAAKLPEELRQEIFRRTDAVDVARLRRVSKQFHRSANGIPGVSTYLSRGAELGRLASTVMTRAVPKRGLRPVPGDDLVGGYEATAAAGDVLHLTSPGSRRRVVASLLKTQSPEASAAGIFALSRKSGALERGDTGKLLQEAASIYLSDTAPVEARGAAKAALDRWAEDGLLAKDEHGSIVAGVGAGERETIGGHADDMRDWAENSDAETRRYSIKTQEPLRRLTRRRDPLMTDLREKLGTIDVLERHLSQDDELVHASMSDVKPRLAANAIKAAASKAEMDFRDPRAARERGRESGGRGS